MKIGLHDAERDHIPKKSLCDAFRLAQGLEPKEKRPRQPSLERFITYRLSASVSDGADDMKCWLNVMRFRELLRNSSPGV